MTFPFKTPSIPKLLIIGVSKVYDSLYSLTKNKLADNVSIINLSFTTIKSFVFLSWFSSFAIIAWGKRLQCLILEKFLSISGINFEYLILTGLSFTFSFKGILKKYIFGFRFLGNWYPKSVDPRVNNILITGDVSFFYDLNALHILEHNKINLSIVIINNKGGQIFSRLPYSKVSIKDFKKYWITPSNKKIKDVAQLFKLKYCTFTVDEINQKIKRVINSSGVKIIEVTVNEKTDIMFNENIEKKILNKLS